MRAGKLNKRIAIQQRVGGQDDAGQPVDSWDTVATVWANIRYLNGMQALKADADTSIAKASIRIRMRSDINAAMRAMLGGTVFKINAVLPDEEGDEYVDLVCEVSDE